MLRTRQQLENSKFFQENDESLRLSGTTFLGTYTGKSFSIANHDMIAIQADEFNTESKGSSFESTISFFNGPNLPDNDVRSVKDNDDHTEIFFGTFGGGIWELDFNEFATSVYNETSGNYDNTLGAVPNNIISLSYMGGFVYITSSIFGFTKFDPQNLVAVNYTNVTSNYSGDTLPSVSLLSSYPDPDGVHIWFISSTQGFVKFNTNTNVVTRYTSTSGNYTGTALSNGGRAVQFLNDNHWLLTTSGLYKMDSNSSVTIYDTSKSNYTGDVIPTSGIANMMSIGDELWCSHNTGSAGGYWKLNTLTNVATRYSSSSDNYNGDTFSTSPANTPLYDSITNSIYAVCSGLGVSRFNLSTLINEYSDIVDYVNGGISNGDRLLYHGDDINIGSSYFLIGRISSSNGVSLVSLSNSTAGVTFSKTGLHYNSEPLSTEDTLIPTKKYVDLTAKTPVGVDGSIQFKNSTNFNGTSRLVFDDSNRRLKIHDENNVVTGGTNSTAIGSNISVDGSYSFGGGSQVNITGSSSIGYGSSLTIDGNYSAAFGGDNNITNTHGFVAGLGNDVTGQYSTSFGRSNISAGSDSFSSGAGSIASGNTTAAFNNSKAYGASSFSQNTGTQAHGNYSHAQNLNSKSYGQASTAIGTWSIASGNSSFAGGTGFDTKNTLAAGISSFNFSRTSGTQETGHGAIADYSAILGGDDHHIAIGNTRAAIIGGSRIKLTGTSYIDHVALPSLVLWNTPTGGSSTDRILVYESSSKKVKSIAPTPKSIIVACSDEATPIETGTSKVTFRMPYNMTLTQLRATLTTAQSSGSILTINVKKNGTTVLSTKITIDNTEKTSFTASTPAVISVTSLNDDDEITVDVDQIGDGTATGLKLMLIGV